MHVGLPCGFGELIIETRSRKGKRKKPTSSDNKTETLILSNKKSERQ